MYLGRIVETGPVSEVLLRLRHPCTQALISVLPALPGEGASTSLIACHLADLDQSALLAPSEPYRQGAS